MMKLLAAATLISVIASTPFIFSSSSPDECRQVDGIEDGKECVACYRGDHVVALSCFPVKKDIRIRTEGHSLKCRIGGRYLATKVAYGAVTDSDYIVCEGKGVNIYINRE